MGELPANVDVVLASPDAGPIPDLAAIDLIVPVERIRQPLIDSLAATGRPGDPDAERRGRLARGHVPEGVTVCNARGVFDVPLAEWVVGAILGMRARPHPERASRRRPTSGPRSSRDELAGRRVVILGHGSIGAPSRTACGHSGSSGRGRADGP